MNKLLLNKDNKILADEEGKIYAVTDTSENPLGPENYYTKEEIEKKNYATKTYVNEVVTSLGGNISGTVTAIEITYAELKSLRDSNKLIAGQTYIITDYQCTTTQEDTQSAGHQFDIIVVADSENTLSEIARARLHKDDTYFADNNLNTWELKYCLDNDKTRFAWADEENGKGVIYYMKDEFNNECPYDFKNIQYKIPYHSTYYYYYTFNNRYNEDASRSADNNIQYNVIKPYITNGTVQYKLNFITFSEAICHHNYIDFDCHDMKLGNQFFYNTFGCGCYNINLGSQVSNNKFGDYCYNISFSSICASNIFESGCNNISSVGTYTQRNIFKSSCYNITLGEFCYDNVFEKQCTNITLGRYCNDNVFKKLCKNNTLGDYCNSNIFNEECEECELTSKSSNNTLGYKNTNIQIGIDTSLTGTSGVGANYNILGKLCSNITIGYASDNNTIGDESTDNTFANACKRNTLGRKNIRINLGYVCSDNTFEDECTDNSLGQECNSNYFESNCTGNTLMVGCDNNSFGVFCTSNMLWNKNKYNIFGNNCKSNSLNELSSNNIFKEGCERNILGLSCFSNSFGVECKHNTLGSNATYNVLNDKCTENQLGEFSNNNVFGNECTNNTIANECTKNTLGRKNIRITLRDGCSNNTFEDECTDNYLGIRCKRNTIKYKCSQNLIGVYEENGIVQYENEAERAHYESGGNGPETYTLEATGSSVIKYVFGNITTKFCVGAIIGFGSTTLSSAFLSSLGREIQGLMGVDFWDVLTMVSTGADFVLDTVTGVNSINLNDPTQTDTFLEGFQWAVQTVDFVSSVVQLVDLGKDLVKNIWEGVNDGKIYDWASFLDNKIEIPTWSAILSIFRK